MEKSAHTTHQIKNNLVVDVIVIGGGLAGLCNAIHISKRGKKVVLIEKNEYPKHKVCGEYISNEVLPYFGFLDINPFDFQQQKVSLFRPNYLWVDLESLGINWILFC
jgi:2-polyprenyl-6-methoxyphenol hydroxylase-like FAD-dependent oxidoreductase